MRSIRIPLVRRFVALLLLTFFGFFTAETVIADSCDGDASARALSVSDASAPDRSPEPAGPIPAHAVHVCHCAHGHTGSLALLTTTDDRAVAAQRVASESVRTPPSASPEPRLRPPLA